MTMYIVYRYGKRSMNLNIYIYTRLTQHRIQFCKWKLRTIKFCFKVRAIDRFINNIMWTLLDSFKLQLCCPFRNPNQFFLYMALFHAKWIFRALWILENLKLKRKIFLGIFSENKRINDVVLSKMSLSNNSNFKELANLHKRNNEYIAVIRFLAWFN